VRSRGIKFAISNHRAHLYHDGRCWGENPKSERPE
jgi:hypothetical protein